jgi:hypothetical protein
MAWENDVERWPPLDLFGAAFLNLYVTIKFERLKENKSKGAM